MEALISVFIILFLIGAISFLKPSKKMKALSQIRMLAAKEGFKIGSTNDLRKKFKNWSPQVAIYQIKNLSEFAEIIKFSPSRDLTTPTLCIIPVNINS